MDTRDIGAELRASREARGLSISLLAQRTRVQPRFLTAIEHNDLSAIPPKPFGRGFVKAFATEVGLDPEETVRDYFARFAPITVVPDVPVRPSAPDPTQPTFTSWTPLILAAIAIATIGLLTFNRGSSPNRIPDAVGTTGATSPSAGSPPRSVASSGATGSAPTPVAASQPRHLLVTLDVSRICWVTATADGQRTIYALLQPGARETVTGIREIVIRAGDAGAITWTVNGRNAGALGGAGEVRTVQVTPDNAATIR